MRRDCRGFTLVEALIVSVTLVVIIGSVIMCNLFGLAMSARQQIWLGASDDAANAVSTLMGDIRSAITLQVGTYSNNVFTQTSATSQQSGNALMVFTNTAATPWILYYYDSVSNNLVRSNYYGAGLPGDFKLVSANPITNDSTHPIFTEVSSTGAPLTVATPLAPISVYLSFTQLQNPQIVIKNGSVVDLYQIIAVVSPRLRL
jgi:type II secretory pathway pseudopilin PulG